MMMMMAMMMVVVVMMMSRNCRAPAFALTDPTLSII